MKSTLADSPLSLSLFLVVHSFQFFSLKLESIASLLLAERFLERCKLLALFRAAFFSLVLNLFVQKKIASLRKRVEGRERWRERERGDEARLLKK